MTGSDLGMSTEGYTSVGIHAAWAREKNGAAAVPRIRPPLESPRLVREDMLTEAVDTDELADQDDAESGANPPAQREEVRRLAWRSVPAPAQGLCPSETGPRGEWSIPNVVEEQPEPSDEEADERDRTDYLAGPRQAAPPIGGARRAIGAGRAHLTRLRDRPAAGATAEW
jgi:hypothetical protein